MNQNQQLPEDMAELFSKFEHASNLISLMVETHAEGLKVLKDMRNMTKKISKYKNRDMNHVLNKKTQIKNDLVKLQRLVKEIGLKFDRESVIVGELEPLLVGLPAAPRHSRTDNYLAHPEVA